MTNKPAAIDAESEIGKKVTRSVKQKVLSSEEIINLACALPFETKITLIKDLKQSLVTEINSRKSAVSASEAMLEDL